MTVLKTLTGAEYHDLAMRTAAGPEAWHTKVDEFEQPTTVFAQDLLAYIRAARVLDRWKSLLIYGKTKDEAKFEPLPTDELIAGIKWDNADPVSVHALLGITTEGGELAELLLWHMCGLDTAELQAGLREETGDIDWFQELLARSTGISVDSARSENIAKLQKRYKDKYSQTEAVDRNDKAPANGLGDPI
jgi:hypothetical protein